MKEARTFAILQCLGGGAVGADDLMAAMADNSPAARNRHRALMHRLTRDGLVNAIAAKAGKAFRRTAKGGKRYRELGKIASNDLPVPRYACVEGGRWLALSFDIPEDRRRLRAWLRAALRALGFTKVHKSLWRGNVELPRQFLEDLKRLELLEYVAVFEIAGPNNLLE